MNTPIYCSYPKAQFEAKRERINEAIARVLDAGVYCLGSEVSAFESEFASYHGLTHCVGVGSGTDALALSLKALGIGVGDEVITVSHTALATVAAIVMTGATPVLIDIEPEYYTLNPALIEEVITSHTKAIIPVHIYGQPCDMEPIVKIARKHDLAVIEDCAQAHGATYKGRKVGTIGDVGCFSFYPTKNLGAIGDGGAIVTNSDRIAEYLFKVRQYGWDENRISQLPGVVSRLDALQAAILRVKLADLDSDCEKRRTLALSYKSFLKGTSMNAPIVRNDCEHAFHLYVTKIPSNQDRDRILEEAKALDIHLGVHYTHPAHVHPGYADKIRISPSGLKNTEGLVTKILSLPMYPELDFSTIKSRMKDLI